MSEEKSNLPRALIITGIILFIACIVAYFTFFQTENKENLALENISEQLNNSIVENISIENETLLNTTLSEEIILIENISQNLSN